MGSAVVQHIDLTKESCFDKEEVDILQSMKGSARCKVEQDLTDDASAAPESSASTRATQEKTTSTSKQTLQKSPSKVVNLIDALRDEYDESEPVVTEEAEHAQEDVCGSFQGAKEGERAVADDVIDEDEDVSPNVGRHGFTAH